VADDDLTALVIDDAADKMAKAVEHARAEFAGVRTGRATSSLVEKLIVDYYGSEVPLQQLAGFSVPEARLLVISPFDKDSISAIEKSIQESDLGLNPSNDGQVIRLAFPQLNAERRQELVRVVRHMAEEGKVALRNLRRAGRDDLKALEKDGDMSADELHGAEKRLDDETHAHEAKIDEALQAKERELLDD
jgi:ribosome recycling factor